MKSVMLLLSRALGAPGPAALVRGAARPAALVAALVAAAARAPAPTFTLVVIVAREAARGMPFLCFHLARSCRGTTTAWVRHRETFHTILCACNFESGLH